MDWIGIGTLGASLIAAIGAVWAVVVSRQQLALAEKANEPDHPIVEATISPVDGQPEWCMIHLLMRNRAEIALDLLGVTIVKPADVGMLTDRDAHDAALNRFGDRDLSNPLPTAKVSRSVEKAARMERAGSSFQHGSGPTAVTVIYAHCPASRFATEPDPLLSLEMRWRDHTTKTFAMAVKVIKPNTT